MSSNEMIYNNNFGSAVQKQGECAQSWSGLDYLQVSGEEFTCQNLNIPLSKLNEYTKPGGTPEVLPPNVC